VAESRIERDGIKAGTQAPVFTLPGLDGRTVSLEDFRGRRVLLVFSDPNCGPCNALAPELVRLSADRAAPQIVMVSRGDVEENRHKAREHGFEFPVVLQDVWKISKEYGIFATPVAFLVDAQGITERPVAIGVDPILELARTPLPPSAISRWRAIGRIAAAFVAAYIMTPLRAALAQATCAAGQINCGVGTNSICVNTATDPNNCGACGHACAPGGVCISGICTPPPCTAGQVNCGAGKCADLTSDAQNCGACGRACAAGQTCKSGTCVQTQCAPGQVNCGTAGCTDVVNDAHNCGACGHACPAGQLCQNGTCRPCRTGDVLCGGTCVDLQNDPHNCGTCGANCPSGVCRGGACVQIQCATALIVCGAGASAACTNVATDPNNCGACGRACPPGEACQSGVCTPVPCATGQIRCGALPGTCANVAADPNNCGACGHACPPGQGCTNGVCAPYQCATGRTNCGSGLCVDLATDPVHCGACGHACQPGQSCFAGVCT
jgi:peroxiredoxin